MTKLKKNQSIAYIPKLWYSSSTAIELMENAIKEDLKRQGVKYQIKKDDKK